MLTLSLLRHAKSSWDDPAVKDFDRELSDRGEKAAPRMGAYMAEHGIQPDLILCSPALRARQTLALVRPHLRGGPEVTYADSLYLAAPSVLLARIRKVGNATRHIMIVGHDPGIQGLSLELSGEGNRELLQALASKFPTAGLAVLTFQLDDWADVAPAAGRLAHFMSPKRLP